MIFVLVNFNDDNYDFGIHVLLDLSPRNSLRLVFRLITIHELKLLTFSTILLILIHTGGAEKSSFVFTTKHFLMQLIDFIYET